MFGHYKTLFSEVKGMPALSIMVKPASGLCNMRCKYCFYSQVVSSRKEGQLGVMSFDTADNLIKKATDFANGDTIYIVFQGGEPLLAGKEYFKHFVDMALSIGYSGKINYSLQTNATLIDNEWAEFFKKNNFLIGVSLDGDIVSNKFRVMADGSGSFDSIEKGIELLEKHKVDYNILSVVTGYFADNLESIYRYFKAKGYKFLQFIPCLKPFNCDETSELYMTELQYQNYLIKLFKLFAKDFLNDNYTSIRSMDNLVRLFAGSSASQCGMNGVCSRQFVIEGNGNIYPCDFYCTDEWLLENINNTDFRAIFMCEKAIKFLKESYIVNEKCKSCECFKICRGGGCKREKLSIEYCNAFKNFYRKCEPLFKKVLAKLQVSI